MKDFVTWLELISRNNILLRSYKYFQPEFLRSLEADRVLRMKNRPFMEYDAKHDIELPKAAAFRNIQSTEVSNIVKRLTMPAKDRFHFQHTDHVAYNDWRTARAEKIQRLRETLHKFGGGSESRVHNETLKKKKKKQKKDKENNEEKSLPTL